MHHHLDVYSYTNRLRSVSPQQKLVFAIALLGMALITQPFTQLVITGWVAVWILIYARIPVKVYLTLVMVAALFWLTSLPALSLAGVTVEKIGTIQPESLGGIVVGNWYVFISRSGLMQAVQIGLRSLASTSCLLFILLTIPFTDLLQVLRQWRVPTVLTELLMMMYRFVFLLLDVATELQLAQRARGGYRTRRRWLYSVGLLASQLLARSLQQYQQFSLAIASRGFNGAFYVYSDCSYRYSKRYALESLLGILGLVILNFHF